MKGLFQIFYEPGKVYDYVREHRAWIAPFLAGLVLFGLMYAYVMGQIGAGNITRHALDGNRFASQMTQEQKDDAVAKADEPAAKARSVAFAVVGYALFLLVFALLFMAIAGVGGNRIRFTQALGTVAYTSWPFAVIRSLLSILVIALAADKADLDAQHLLAFNLGAALDKATTSKPLYALATSFDIITFAEMALGAFGLSRVAQMTFTKALIGIILIWVVFTVLAMGLSFVF